MNNGDDLIRPRTQIVGAQTFVPPLSNKKQNETEILGDILTTNQSRYIDKRPISEPARSRTEFNRLPSLKKDAKKKESSDRSRVTAGIKALRESLPPNELEPRVNGNVLFPRVNRYTTVSAGKTHYDTDTIDIYAMDTLYD